MKILGIDPSVNNVGIAEYNTETKELRTYLFHPKRNEGQSLVHVGNQIIRFISLMYLEEPDRVVIEYPNFQDSAKGQIAAQQGYTLDLAYIVGAIIGGLQIPSAYVFTPTPVQWKGNLPKDAVGARFQKRFGIDPESVSDHEFEAAMMIAWYLDKPNPT